MTTVEVLILFFVCESAKISLGFFTEFKSNVAEQGTLRFLSTFKLGKASSRSSSETVAVGATP